MEKTKKIRKILTLTGGVSTQKTPKSDGIESNIVYHTLESEEIYYDEPNLTVPDLEDSVEQMLARRTAGIKERINNSGERQYPVDPTSLTTALGVVTKHKQELEHKLREQEEHAERTLHEKQQQKEREKQEKQAFESFKKQQQITQQNTK